MTRTWFVVVALSLAALLRPATATAAPESVTVEPKALKIEAAGKARFDRDDLVSFVQTRNGLLECYREELGRDRGAHGRLLVRFVIGKGGDVVEVTVLRSGLSPKLVECVTHLMADWLTPFRPDGPVTIECPLVFSTEG